MRMIFEQDIERTDFLEIILSDDEMELVHSGGWGDEFKEGLQGNRPLNVYIRLENELEREEIMPLVKGPKAKTRKGFSENVEREMEAGKPQKQAVAIAYSEARKGKKKTAKKGKK